MNKFRAPVYPIPPSFDVYENLDLESTKKYIQYLSGTGAQIAMTTAGTSQYNLLSVDEVRKLNTIVSSFDGEKILGLPPLSTKHLLEEIDWMNSNFEPMDTSLLILFPERYYDDDQIVEFFEEICSKSDFDILVHGNILKKGMGGSYEYSKPLLDRLSEIDGFIGMKEEAGNLMHSTTNIPSNLEVIVAGGSMKRFWALEPHGATTYLVGVGSFNPAWEEIFYDDYSDSHMPFEHAHKIIKTVETPLFDVFMKNGWHLSMRTALKHMGYIKFDRKPFKQPTEEQKQEIINAVNKVL